MILCSTQVFARTHPTMHVVCIIFMLLSATDILIYIGSSLIDTVNFQYFKYILPK
jgi:hypothetical protein